MDPIPVERMFAQAWELYSGRLKELLLVGALGAAASLVCLFVPPAAVWAWGGLGAGPAAWTLAGLAALSGALWFGSWSQAAVLRVLLDEASGDPVSRYRETAGAVVPFSWVCLLGFVFASGGLWVLLVPGLYLGLGLLFAPVVFMDEGRQGLAALERSLELVRGRWWATAGRVVLAWAAAALPSFIPVLGPVAGAIAAPFALAAGVVLYRDLAASRPPAPGPSLGHRALLAVSFLGLLWPLKVSVDLVQRLPRIREAVAGRLGAFVERPLDPVRAQALVESLASAGLTPETARMTFELIVSSGTARPGGAP